MTLTKDDIASADKLLASAQKILVICHRNPDGDAIGSLLGLGLLLEKAYPDVPVSLHCTDPVPESFAFLPAAGKLQGPPTLLGNETIVTVDSATPQQTDMHETHPLMFDKSMPSICIDHHPDNPRYMQVNLIVPDAASTCEIIVTLADEMGWTLDSDIATCLLTGVYTDTGGLLHSNTTAAVYRTVARLVREGGKRQEMVQKVFQTAKLSTLRLWGRVLEKISVTEEGGAVSAVTQGDFRATGADYSELTGAIDYVNAVPGMRFSMVLHERDGKVKGSIRTLRDDVDVSAMAGKFQGGGHKRAAGFSLKGHLQPEVRWKVVEDEQ